MVCFFIHILQYLSMKFEYVYIYLVHIIYTYLDIVGSCIVGLYSVMFNANAEPSIGGDAAVLHSPDTSGVKRQSSPSSVSGHF